MWWTIETIFHQKKFIKHFRDGIIILQDFLGTEVLKARSMLTKEAMRSIMSMQNCVPMRLKYVLLFNTPIWIRIILGLARPFMKQKLRKRIEPINATLLPRYINKDNLLKHTSYPGSLLEFDLNAYIQNNEQFK